MPIKHAIWKVAKQPEPLREVALASEEQLEDIWRVSRHLEPHRSPGEEALARLAGQRLLPSAESAYAPKRQYLEWRLARLLS